MPTKYYVLPEEREQMQKEALNQAVSDVKGFVTLYEHWPGEGPCLVVTDKAAESQQIFCKLVWENEIRKGQCLLDYEETAAVCKEPQISLCWLGVHHICCPVTDEHGGNVTLIGGEFRVHERKAEAEKRLEEFLKSISPEEREKFHQAWHQIPEISEAEVHDRQIRELEFAGLSYLYALKQRGEFRYAADLATHDVVMALQALIAEIEVLKIELKQAFNIGQKWGDRFEKLIRMCEQHYRYLETKLGLDKPKYTYESISKLIHECVNLYLPKAKARGIEFRVELEQITDREGKHQVLMVRMDRVALRQVLRNIFDNAVKYSFSGTAEHPRWIKVVGRLQEVEGVPGYSLVVSNLGIGIEEDELDLVFEPEYQGRRRLQEARPGYGMGLTTVKEYIEKHGGNISIHSHPKQRTGWLTTVSIWLPLNGPTQNSGEA